MRARPPRGRSRGSQGAVRNGAWRKKGFQPIGCSGDRKWIRLAGIGGEAIPVAASVFDVVMRDIAKTLHFLVRQASNDLAGYAKHEGPVGNRLAFRDQCA